MSSEMKLSKMYSLAALLIHSTKQDVSVDKIRSVFNSLKLKDFNEKIASLFVLSEEKYNQLLTSGISGGMASNTGNAGNAQAEKVKEDIPEEEEEEVEVIDFDF